MRFPRIRQPEYTGSNRCIPCTVVNLGIALLLSILIGIVSIPVGILSFLMAVVLIYLRGYLIPGTPSMTARFLPAPILDLFDKQPSQAASTPNGTLDLETWLWEHGVVEECHSVDDLCLTESFATAWEAEIDAVKAEEESQTALADILAVPEESVTFDEFGRSFVARHNGRQIGQWESPAALTADLGAARALDDSTPAWRALSIDERGGVLNGLRIFLDQCPDCDGNVTMAEETVRSCCRSRDVVAVTCDDCGARLLEADYPEEPAATPH